MSANIISISNLKATAKMKLAGNWKNAIIVNLLYLVIAGAAKISFLGYFILIGPMTFGVCSYFLGLARDKKPNIESLFEVFKNFKLIVKSLILFFVTTLFILLWTLIFIIPGIIACLKYSQSFFILNDNPNTGPLQAIELSKKMMEGYKGKLFFLYLSFIGWVFLCLLSGGIGFIWLIPYVQTTLAQFYLALKKSSAAGSKKVNSKKVAGKKAKKK